jgi:hypothetical protein
MSNILLKETFSLSFEVPVGRASDIRVISSDITWTQFINQVLTVMDLAPSKVDLAYRFSNTAVKDRSHVLRQPAHLAALFEIARPLLIASQEKQGKKPFQVVLENQIKQDDGKKGKAGDKKRSGGGLAKVGGYLLY